MPEFSLDVSDFTKMLDDVSKVVKQSPRNAEKLVKQSAAYLRATDWYQNRTGDLRASTQAVAIDGGAALVMGMEYASYVEARGFSGYYDVAEQTKEWMRVGLQTALDRAAR